MKPYELQNGKTLNEQQFIRYFEKKVLYTIRRFNLIKNSNFKVQDLLKIKKINNIIISKECLDDISYNIIKIMMENKSKELFNYLPSTNKTIRPFYLMSQEEINLYSKIKRIKLIQKKSNPILEWINEMEKKQPSIKNSIVHSLLKIQELKKRKI